MSRRAPENILRLVDDGTRERGRRYWQEGRVLRLGKVRRDGTVEAQVAGSRGAVYRVKVWTEPDRQGRPVVSHGHCSCPMVMDCKHVVAVALALSEAAEAKAPPPKPAKRAAPKTPAKTLGVPSLLAHWLDDLSRAESAAAVEAESPDGFPTNVRDRLIPLIDIERGRLRIQPVKVRLGRGNRFTGTPQPYDGRHLLRGAPRPKFLRPIDLALLERLAYRAGAPQESGPSAAMLRAALATGQARWGSLEGPVLWEDAPRRGGFVWESAGEGRDLRQHLVVRRLEGEAPTGPHLTALPLAPPWYLDLETGAMGVLETGHPPEVAQVLTKAPPVAPEEAAALTQALAKRAPKRQAASKGATPRPALPLPESVAITERQAAPPQPVLLLDTVEITLVDGYYRRLSLTLPVLAPRFDYAGAEATALADPDPLRLQENGALLLLARDREAETAHFETLAPLALDQGFAPPEAFGQDVGRELLRDHDAADHIFLPVWLEDTLSGLHSEPEDPETYIAEIDTAALTVLAETVEHLRTQGWRIETAPDWPWALYRGPLSFSAGSESSGIDWFSFELSLEADGQRLDLLPLVVSILDCLPLGPDGQLDPEIDLAEFLSGLPLFPALPDGTRVWLDGAQLAPMVAAVLEAQGLLAGFHPAEAGSLSALAEALEGCGVPWRGDRRLLDLGERLRTLGQTALPPPPGLGANLRAYQKTGYSWLMALAETGFGGLLADEMGLGKTLQTLALLLARHSDPEQDRPSLLIVPTSLVPTWQREAARFAPGLRLLVVHGPSRHAEWARLDEADVVLTTYPLLHRDIERLADQPYDTVVLDEAQAVKNPAAAAAKHIRRLEARTRLALTGTPVENALLDLWALFDWLIPGLLGNRSQFTKVFRTPIERHGDTEAQARLNARLAPFLLRRTKQAVATELPPRTEIDEPVTLAGAQRGLYESIRVAMDVRVREAIAAKGVSGARITILDALLKLRQAACDPALVKLEAARKVGESAKRARLLELLESLIAEGRQVLVFSQFVSMLRLIEADITARGWSYALLTGQTRDRAAAVERFQSGEASLFLISLKAGGTGLTLTAADTVILYDPWWNPAAECQAMDRAHRIGQDKPVFVHRLIAEGTVEAAIRSLQARKQALADGVFDAEGTSLPKALDEGDIAELFAPVA
ncbi:MAG: SNF2-related protein [Pseudomonadota bacterium]